MKQQILFISIFILGFIGYNSFFIVKEQEQAVVTQFGKPVGESVTTPGFQFKIPFIQKVQFFEKRILKWDGEPNSLTTNDKTFIWVDTTARWRVKDPLLFLKSVKDTFNAERIIRDRINGSVRDFVQKYDLIEIIRSSDWQPEYTATTEKQDEIAIKVGRDRFSQEVKENVAQKMEGLGIELLDVLIKRINYTDTVRNNVYERMISERQRIAEKIRSDGQAEKARIIGRMNREFNEIISKANEEAQIIRGQADKKATEIYSQYAIDPEFYKFYSTLESYKKTLGENTSLVINTDSPFYNLFKDINFLN